MGSFSWERNSTSARRWSLLHSHRFCRVCEYTKGDWIQQWNLSPCWYGLLARLSRGATSRASRVDLSYTHNCLQVPTESQRSLNRQQYLTLPVLVGLPSSQWHYSSLYLKYSHWMLIISEFQSPLQFFQFFWFINGSFLFKWSRYAHSLGVGIIISFKVLLIYLYI